MTRLVLPDVERVRSWHTGWGREHWERLADHLLASVEPWVSPGAARIALPGRESRAGADSDALEGFARSFMLAAFRIAGAKGVGCERWIERYARGLAAGTDPDHPEAWSGVTSRAQQMVEAAGIAIALHESRPWIWDRLDTKHQERIAAWLGGFIGATTHDNNWRLFQVVSEQFLASVGAPHSTAEIEAGLDRIEDWYLGDGWYSDGDGQNFDYYIGWAMHFYPGLWARIAAATPGTAYEDRLTTYRERLKLFLADAVHLIGGDGAPVHQGRSLCYRMASATPFWMGALLDATPLSPGSTRRICSSIARHFVERGVPDQRGLLTLGWYDAFLPTTQSYSGPGSPYWASKGFVGLVLPPDHPVWTEPEGKIPLDDGDQTRAMPAPGWLLHATRHDNVVRLLNHGSDRITPRSVGQPPDPHYDRLAYANHAGPEASDASAARRIDNQVVLFDDRCRRSTRGVIKRLPVTGRTAASWFEAWLGEDGPWRIETASVVRGGWEIRAALVAGPPGSVVHSGGYAIASNSLPSATTGQPWAVARADDLVTAVVGLHGYDNAAVRRELGANAFGSHSATPYLTAPHTGEPVLLVSAVLLAREVSHPETVAEGIEVDVHGTTVTVTFPDGDTERLTLGSAS